MTLSGVITAQRRLWRSQRSRYHSATGSVSSVAERPARYEESGLSNVEHRDDTLFARHKTYSHRKQTLVCAVLKGGKSDKIKRKECRAKSNTSVNGPSLPSDVRCGLFQCRVVSIKCVSEMTNMGDECERRESVRM